MTHVVSCTQCGGEMLLEDDCSDALTRSLCLQSPICQGCVESLHEAVGVESPEDHLEDQFT